MIGGVEQKRMIHYAGGSRNEDQDNHAPISHAAGAIADTDATYGAYAAAENKTLRIRHRACAQACKGILFMLCEIMSDICVW